MDLQANALLASHCGLYCGACRRYKDGNCLTCHGNDRGTWCQIRECCQSHGYNSCANCEEFGDPAQCPKYSNVVSRILRYAGKLMER